MEQIFECSIAINKDRDVDALRDWLDIALKGKVGVQFFNGQKVGVEYGQIHGQLVIENTTRVTSEMLQSYLTPLADFVLSIDKLEEIWHD